MVGLVIEAPHIARKGYAILNNSIQVGLVTSGTFSPTLDRSIAMGYVASENTAQGTRLQVNIRGALVDAQVVALPFYTRKRSS
jgi:aminomethyltransferase